LNRRSFLAHGAAVLAGAVLPSPGFADVPSPYDWTAAPPFDSRAAFVTWMMEKRGEDPLYLGERFDRFQQLLQHRDLFTDRDRRAFLMTPREEFCLKANLAHVYDRAFLDIGFGVTISGPNLVGRMTSSLAVAFGDNVLEVGTGSGYQSAYLSNLTDKVWSIEIIKPLFERTRRVYDALIARGYVEYQAITTRQGDGYYGWEDASPFDKIIVTCGIDHVPAPLLQQLRPGGVMVIPIGPPGAQHVLKIVKRKGLDGTLTVARADIYGGSVVPFVPFTKLEGGVVKGTHNL
jgi:protein-L-isoaspartate(D-aspartate) O-methyltransferase